MLSEIAAGDNSHAYNRAAGKPGAAVCRAALTGRGAALHMVADKDTE
jgi:hypothetical protein